MFTSVCMQKAINRLNGRFQIEIIIWRNNIPRMAAFRWNKIGKRTPKNSKLIRDIITFRWTLFFFDFFCCKRKFKRFFFVQNAGATSIQNRRLSLVTCKSVCMIPVDISFVSLFIFFVSLQSCRSSRSCPNSDR